jgi:hypothetical protein
MELGTILPSAIYGADALIGFLVEQIPPHYPEVCSEEAKLPAEHWNTVYRYRVRNVAFNTSKVKASRLAQRFDIRLLESENKAEAT